MKLLIPGGAGYIGSHMVKYAQERGHEVVVLDDFSTGHDWAVKDCEILRVNLLEQDRLAQLLRRRHFDGVIHFAAKSLVAESVKRPDLYYRNNVIGTLNLLNELLINDVNNLVFSSTAAIFGNPTAEKIDERHPKMPINPYGQSKLIVENILSDYCNAFDLNATCFRYFNAAGADPSGEIGEAHDPETHLIPNIMKSVLSRRAGLAIFGDDYSTPDGTCIRDFVHVNDLAQAHLQGLEKGIREDSGFTSYNLGNGNGFSVLDVIKAAELVLEESIDYRIAARRAGDPDVLVADSSRAASMLGWLPYSGDLTSILKSAWDWHKKYENEIK